MTIGWARVGVAALAASVIGSAGLAAPLPKGKVAPAWSAKTVQGKSVSSAQFKGKVVLLNFFSYY